MYYIFMYYMCWSLQIGHCLALGRASQDHVSIAYRK